MKVLIFDHSLVPDSDYQQRIRQLFTTIADVTVRFVNGLIDATWQIRHFRPDVIVFDWFGDWAPISKLVTILHRITPDAAMFHLDGDGFIVTASLRGLPTAPAVPQWLRPVASDWILVRRAHEQTVAS